MENELTWLLLIPALPLAAFVIQIFVGRYLPREGDWVSIGAVVGSFLISLQFFIMALEHYGPGFSIHYEYTWVQFEGISLTMGLLVDNLTAVMLMVVTGVGGLIQIYSSGYMEDDPGYYRFFAYLSLFTFSMLGIVLTDNLFGLFVFWELVGLSSYFLIGFWYEKPSAANASKKAFLTTRVGDLGMLLGIMMLVWYLAPHTYTPLAYETIFEYAQSGFFDPTVLGAIGILLFFGAVGKSAQLPLHVWLPDAMEGPTPVSALIHAATMVAAGVYMVARLTPFLNSAALLFIAYTGALTAFFAASIALVKNDIKKGLAYSTVSQLGYMFLALGLGGYVAGVFHLTTHAIFKALLFLGSGSIIHAVHTQDMRQMGGLWRKMPVTFVTFFTATLAISGVPFFSGFLSKEKILETGLLFGWNNTSELFASLHMTPFLLGMAAAGMTAFYMFRMVFMTFFGEPGDEDRYEHAHESPMSMTIPMAILAVFCFGFFFQAGPVPGDEGHAWLPGQSVITSAHAAESAGHGNSSADHGSEKHAESAANASHSGWFQALIQNPDPLAHYSHAEHKAAKNLTGTLSMLFAGGGILWAATLYASIPWIIGAGVAMAVLSLTVNYWVWILLLGITGGLFALRNSTGEIDLSDRLVGIRKLLAAKYYFDEFYRDVLVTPTLVLSNVSSWVDNNIVDGIVNLSASTVKVDAFISGAVDDIFVDGLVNGIANTLGSWGQKLRQLQTGEIQWYLNFIALGLGLVLLVSVIF